MGGRLAQVGAHGDMGIMLTTAGVDPFSSSSPWVWDGCEKPGAELVSQLALLTRPFSLLGPLGKPPPRPSVQSQSLQKMEPQKRRPLLCVHVLIV